MFVPLVVGSYASAESMKNAVKTALTTNPSSKASLSDVRAIGDELSGLKSEYLPSVDLFGELGGQVVENDNVLSVSDSGRLNATRQIGVSTELTLFDGFRRANLVYRNAARLDGSIYRLLANSETIALNAVEAYIDVVRHRNLLHIAKRNVSRHFELADQVRARVSGGKSPISDGFQAQERFLAAREAVTGIEQSLRDAEARYKRVVGHKPRGKMSIPYVKRLPKNLNALISSSIANNNRIKLAGTVANEAGFEREILESGRLPRVSLNGRTSYGADRNGSRGNDVDAFLGVNLSWSLYNGGARKKEISAQQHRIDQANYQREDITREVKELASRAWNSLTANQKRSALLRQQVQANRKIVQNYIEEFQLSKRSLLDVLDAERAKFNNEVQKLSSEASLSFARFRMLAAQSKLAGYFGHDSSVVVGAPTFEKKLIDTPRAIFNIELEPLR
ncbi:MAG: TolC family protein [Hyphomicrobiales bacterium]